MKKLKLFLVLILVPFLVCATDITEVDMDIGKILKSKNFKEYKFNTEKIPTPEHLSIIWFILSNTEEVKIHQMRGEKDNTVYIRTVKENGGYGEAVFDSTGKPVTNSYNKASFNYYFYENEPIKHFQNDTLPWLEYGNTRDDPTSFQERLYHYTLDLNGGIQAYISKSNSENLPKIDLNELSSNEKLVYQFFDYILFNVNFEIKLNKENLLELKNNSNYYWKYFAQIQKLLKVKK